MKTILKKFIYTINKNSLSKSLFNRKIRQRSKLALTNIESLSKHINMFSPFTNEIQPINDWYGHAKILKKFLGLSENYQFKFIIEHGLYLSNQVADIELESNLPSFITYSSYRAKVLRKIRPYVFVVGPLIHYASHYLTNKELKEEKRRLGKTLLFFPSHSLIGLKNEYDLNWSYRKIEAIGKKFDTIRVCLYWKDVLLGKHEFYQKRGLECVTAGHVLDPMFLPRLKSIIQLSDLTVSNDASSPLSYCIYMNKPHIIFYQRPKMSGKGYLKKVMIDYWKSRPYHQIINAFSKIQYTITPKQLYLINYYCGTNSVKTKTQLMSIVEKTEQIFQEKFR